jgi:hypothetical protein
MLWVVLALSAYVIVQVWALFLLPPMVLIVMLGLWVSVTAWVLFFGIK